MNSLKMPLRKKSRHQSQSGQVALFVALIFQVLFVFFAMIVNVGLLVHHKINLQNSVDLAAYYGAMKQAEMMNAIGHVNYQIRQSFKLLTFRYRQLGTAGLASSPQMVHPFRAGNVNGINGTSQILREEDRPLPFDTSFCIPYQPWDFVKGNENYCKNVERLEVPKLGVPAPSNHPLTNVANETFIDVSTQLNKSAGRFCEFSMSMNWLQLAKFIAAYKYDVRNRKKLLLSLANEISKENPRDIQGESIRAGVFQTLYKNLTGPNKESLGSAFDPRTGTGNGNQEADFKFINSLSLGNCRGGNTDSMSPPGWLHENFVFPIYAIFDGECEAGPGDSDGLAFKATYMNVGQQTSVSPNISRFDPALEPKASELAELASEHPSNDPQRLLFRTSIGFEKNPWCMGYVGVSATTTPKIPFTPLGSVTMRAKAFAKPFGGRIGPWFGKTWPSGAQESYAPDSSAQTEPVMTMRVGPDIQIQNLNPGEWKGVINLVVNHSRYLGDSIGVISELTMAHFAQAIHRIGNSGGRIVSGWWNHTVDPNQDFDNPNSMGDSLAWDQMTNSAPPMRFIETAAVAPDQFDTATYSIDPDFYNNYLIKIKKGYGSEFKFSLRGDLGSRMQGSPEEKRFSIRNQIETFRNISVTPVDIQSKLTYYLNHFGQVLTAWQQRTPDSYVLDDARFGKCLDQSGDEIRQDGEDRFFTIGSCKAGGRTGYSVKLVDGLYLNNQPGGYSLGGPNTSGNILNPPPSDF